MSQNDLSIANQGFASFRSDLNSALQALGSTNSGTSAPSTTYANQLFYDTTNNSLKIRNEDNDAFINLITLDQTNDKAKFDLDGTELILDADGDTSITADTDDRVDIKVAGSDVVHVTSTGLSVGTNSPATDFHVAGASYSAPTNGLDSNINLLINNTQYAGLGLLGANNGSSFIHFGDGDDMDVGQINYVHADNAMTFFTSGAQKVTIDSSGNLLVAKTSNDSGTAVGAILGNTGVSRFTADGAHPVVVKRKSDDGTIVQIEKDSSVVGSIETSGGNLIVQGSTATGKTGIKFGGAEFIPQDNGNSDNGVDLGMSSARFKDLYLGGGIYVGGTGSANHLTDFEEGTFDPFSGRGSQFTGETTRTARYRKIGTMVAIDVRVKFTGTDATSTFQLTLPFTSASASGDATSYTGSCFYEGTQLFSGASLHPHVASSSAHLVLHRGDGGTFQSVTRSNVNGTYDFLISFVYFSA